MKTKLLYILFLSTITIYSQTQIGTDIDGEASNDESGRNVSLSSDGSILAIGAYYNDGNGVDSGHVRVYKNNSGTWGQLGSDINGEASGDESGWSVSLSSNGSIVAIGAPNNDGNGTNSGHVRVFKYNSGNWIQLGADINGEVAGDKLGYSVSLSSDGSTVAIGARYNDGNGANSGHVRVFNYVLNTWTQLGSDIDGKVAGDQSGFSVSSSSSGNRVAIGAFSNDDNGSNSGHVRVFEYILNAWTQLGLDINGESPDDQSGENISLSADGNTLAIGAPYNDGVNGVNSGHVRVFKYVLNAWSQIGADIDGENGYDYLGSSVSLSADGNIVAVGAIGNNGTTGNFSGHARIFKYDSSSWAQLGVDVDGEAIADRSGRLSLSSDGNTVAVGAPFNDGASSSNSNYGHVRVYNLSALLSLEDNEISKNFTVYPNPVKNQLHLQLATILEYKKATIYNYTGQLVLHSKSINIDVSSLSTGVYFLEVETAKGKGIQKIIKQ